MIYAHVPRASQEKPKESPLDTQVAGDHYKKTIQPIEYIYANKLDFIEGNVVKYVTRWKDKNGVEDLKKAKHYLEILIDLATKEGDNIQKRSLGNPHES